MCDYNVTIKEEKIYSVKGKAGMRYEEPTMEIILFEPEQVRTVVATSPEGENSENGNWSIPF